MIQYSTGNWSLFFLLRWKGSVFPKALVWAIPAGLNAVLIDWLWYDIGKYRGFESGTGVGAVWSSFTFVLGFLVVFRTQQAYTRYWEGATLVQQARANFFNASSSVVAFCTADAKMKAHVEEFQHLLIRLMSMLHCVGLQTVADAQEVNFEFFNTEGLDPESLSFLSSKSDRHQKCEIVIQWIQRLVVDGSRAGVVDVPAPILTRFFQELSQGAVHIINARNMTGIPFPFPYAQLLTALLIAHWAITPFFCVMILNDPVWASVFTFISVFAFFGANYIAAEIESPFGDDPNDLPLHALQQDMNKSLWVLLHPRSQAVPQFRFDKHKHRRWDVVVSSNFVRLSAKTRLKQRKSKMWTEVPHEGDLGRMSDSIVNYNSGDYRGSFASASNSSIVIHDSRDSARNKSIVSVATVASQSIAPEQSPQEPASGYSLWSSTETMREATSPRSLHPGSSFTVHSQGVRSATEEFHISSSDLSAALGFEMLPSPDVELPRHSFQSLVGNVRNATSSYQDGDFRRSRAGFADLADEMIMDGVQVPHETVLSRIRFHEDGDLGGGIANEMVVEEKRSIKSKPSSGRLSKVASLPSIPEAYDAFRIQNL